MANTPLEIIERTPQGEYESICDAGVELVQELTLLLRRHGLDRCQAFNVLIVAAAGVAAASEMTSVDLAEGVDAVIHMWKVSDEEGDRIAVFDPTGMPSGHDAVDSDPMSAN